jgi:hypothetical protein
MSRLSKRLIRAEQSTKASNNEAYDRFIKAIKAIDMLDDDRPARFWAVIEEIPANLIQPELKPIPMQELRPGKLDCNANGECWIEEIGVADFVDDTEIYETIPSRLILTEPDSLHFDCNCRWLPYWAISI